MPKRVVCVGPTWCAETLGHAWDKVGVEIEFWARAQVPRLGTLEGARWVARLARRGGDVRAYVGGLEDWLIATLAAFGVRGERRQGRVGVWVARGGGEAKIAAIGVRIRRWVSYHGVSLNVAPELAHYRGIVACGIPEHGVTSLAELGIEATMAEVDEVLRETFARVFSATA